MLIDRKLTGINYLYGRYTRHGLPDGHDGIVADLPQSFMEISCKGKFIYMTLQNDWTIWNTLGMTGGWSKTRLKHSRAEFCLDDGTSVYFNDIRNFGTLKYVHGRDKLKIKLGSLGPDMLAESVPNDVFADRIKSKSDKTIAEVLMDQTVICGVGNYLKSESLYFAKISPHRTCKSLEINELDRLNNVIQRVIRQSYSSGGATIYTFQSFEGSKGQYTRRFAVYNQRKDPLGRDVESFTSPGGRTTFWVPEEQI